MPRPRLGRLPKRCCGIWLAAAVGLLANLSARGNPTLVNEQFEVELLERGAVDVVTTDGIRRRFQPQFTVLFTPENPDLQLSIFQVSRDKLGENAVGQPGLGHLPYRVATWGRTSNSGGLELDPGFEDGFDPTIDREYGEGRTANYYHAAPRVTLIARRASLEEGAIHWHFDKQEQFQLKATVRLPRGTGPPVLSWVLVIGQSGYYSVGYVGAPKVDRANIEAIWQPMIWNERRFPDRPYLTQAFRCPLPTTLVTWQGVTTGVVADPAELPFMPLPTQSNSPFGVMVRTDRGEAQAAIFSPVLGGKGSHGKVGEQRTFSAHLIVHRGDCQKTFVQIARTLYRFRDYRRNAICTLNTTLENMIDYGMSHWSRFNDELRGCDYSTDAPGAVKNVSALHPLSIALVTDNDEILERRAWPMIEYGMSRERSLFTTNPKQQTQGASTRMTGPAAPLSEWTALYEMSGRRNDLFLATATELYGQDRVFNLNARTRGDRWQNALAIYRATGDDPWRQRTIRLVDDYLRRRLGSRPTDWSDPDAEGMFFWPSFVPQWIELLELYETIPESRYLEAAHRGALDATQFTWFCPRIPEGKVRVNIGGKAPRYRAGTRFEDIELPEEEVDAWRVSEIGLTPESAGTCAGHRAIFNAHYAPSMLRLAKLTGDSFLRDVARSAIVGRYASFPGYHMNTARTTVYEKPDFPQRPITELNGVTSLHFNHIWPHISLLVEYLVADAFLRSDGQIDFPSAYCEGYAYLQGKVYGHAPGRFYGDDEVWLWMPKGLVDTGHIEVNYLAARGNGSLYLVFTNQSADPLTTTVRLNEDLLPLPARPTAHVWRDNQSAGEIAIQQRQFAMKISPRGITAVRIAGTEIRPKLQYALSAADDQSQPDWMGAFHRQTTAGLTGMVLSLGPRRSRAYVYSRAPLGEFAGLDLHFQIDGRPWQVVADTSYPFEWTVPLPPEAVRLEYFAEGITADGRTERTEPVSFNR
jgi:hypothetical protein